MEEIDCCMGRLQSGTWEFSQPGSAPPVSLQTHPWAQAPMSAPLGCPAPALSCPAWPWPLLSQVPAAGWLLPWPWPTVQRLVWPWCSSLGPSLAAFSQHIPVHKRQLMGSGRLSEKLTGIVRIGDGNQVLNLHGRGLPGQQLVRPPLSSSQQLWACSTQTLWRPQVLLSAPRWVRYQRPPLFYVPAFPPWCSDCSFQASLLLDVHFWKSYDFASTWANSLTNDMTVTRRLWFLHAAICTSVVFNSNISAHLLPGARECHGDACTSHCSLRQWACTQGASAPGVRTDYLRCVPTEMVGERKVT